MRTWSVESVFVEGYSLAAVVVQGLLDAFKTVERITRPPRMGHDVLDGASQLFPQHTKTQK